MRRYRGKYTPAGNGGSWIRSDKRLAIHMRDGMTCVYCGQSGCPLQLDHYIRVQDGGSNQASNLVTACISCNSSKGNDTIRRWYKRLRAKGIVTTRVQRRVRRLMSQSLTSYRRAAKQRIAMDTAAQLVV